MANFGDISTFGFGGHTAISRCRSWPRPIFGEFFRGHVRGSMRAKFELCSFSRLRSY